VGMAVRKVSVSLDEMVVKRTREAAERQGVSVSAWLSEAAKQGLKREADLAVIDEVVSELGEPSPEGVAWADRVLAPMMAYRDAARKQLGV